MTCYVGDLDGGLGRPVRCTITASVGRLLTHPYPSILGGWNWGGWGGRGGVRVRTTHPSSRRRTPDSRGSNPETTAECRHIGDLFRTRKGFRGKGLDILPPFAQDWRVRRGHIIRVLPRGVSEPKTGKDENGSASTTQVTGKSPDTATAEDSVSH